jgi:hypothetical protein
MRRGTGLSEMLAFCRVDSTESSRLGGLGSQKEAARSCARRIDDPYYTGQGGPLQTPNSAPPFSRRHNWVWRIVRQGANPFAGSGFAEPMTLLTLDRNLRLPYAQDWNLGIQRSFGADWLFEVGYVGTKGTKLPRFIEGNPAVFSPGATEDNVNQRRLYSGCTLAQPTPCNFASVGLIAGIANSVTRWR